MRATLRPEGLCQFKNANTSSGIEHAAFRPAAPCHKQPRYRMPPPPPPENIVTSKNYRTHKSSQFIFTSCRLVTDPNNDFYYSLRCRFLSYLAGYCLAPWLQLCPFPRHDWMFFNCLLACLLNCCWPSPAQWSLVPSPTELRPYFTLCRLCESSDYCDFVSDFQLKVKFKVILRPTVSRLICLGIKHHLGLKTKFVLLSDSWAGLLMWGVLSDERKGSHFPESQSTVVSLLSVCTVHILHVIKRMYV
jgi:hypothetical protein